MDLAQELPERTVVGSRQGVILFVGIVFFVQPLHTYGDSRDKSVPQSAAIRADH